MAKFKDPRAVIITCPEEGLYEMQDDKGEIIAFASRRTGGWRVLSARGVALPLELIPHAVDARQVLADTDWRPKTDG